MYNFSMNFNVIDATLEKTKRDLNINWQTSGFLPDEIHLILF